MNNRTTRVTVFALAALLLAGLAMMPAVKAQQTSIEFWTLSLSPFFDKQMQQIADAFEAAHPGVEVRWTDVPFNAIEQKLLSAIAAGNPPDAVNLSSDMAIKLFQQGALADLGSLAEKPGFDVYFPKALETFVEDATGVVYGVPWYWAPKVLAYNAEIFQRAGLDPENPPSTVAEMIAAAKQIKDKTGLYGFMPNINNINLLFAFQEAGLPILNADGTKAVFNSPEHVAYLQQLVDLYKQDYFPEDTIRRGYLGATELFTAGRLGMLLTGPQFLIRVANDNPQVYAKTRATAYPLDKGQVVHTPLMGFVVPVNAKNKKLGAEFALFITNDENQLMFSKASNTFPSTVAATKDPYFTTQGPTAADQARVADARQLQFAADLTLFVPNASTLFTAFKDSMEAAFFGAKSPKQALDDAVKVWNANL